LDFVERIHSQPLHRVPVGNRVAVIGGGNTAIDAVTQAKRLGAEKAVLIYRRSQDDMSAYDFEQDMAKNDEAEFLAGTEWVEPFDMVIKAIGEQKQVNVLKQLFPALELDKRGVVVHNRETGQTNLPKIFTGGDCAN